MVIIWYGKAQRWEMTSYQSQVARKNFTGNSYGTNTESDMRCSSLGLYSKKVVIRLIPWPEQGNKTSKWPKKTRFCYGMVGKLILVFKYNAVFLGKYILWLWGLWERSSEGNRDGSQHLAPIHRHRQRQADEKRYNTFVYLLICLLWECKVCWASNS